jgi:diadenosine tetraphosphate (Ap4A) HIT family hydrolase
MKFIKTIILSFILALTLNAPTFSAASLDTPKDSWAINENIQSVLKSFPASEVLKALGSFNIEASLVEPQDFIQQYKILEGTYFTVYLAPRTFQRDHIWILTHPDTPSQFEDLTLDQLKELESFRYLIGEVYQNHLKYDGYVSFINAAKQYGLNRPALCLEMLPAQYKGKNHDQVDILEKLERVWYVLFGVGPATFFTPLQANEKIEKINVFLTSMQHDGISLASQKRIVKSTLPWNRKLIHLQKLKEYCFSEFHKELIKGEDLFLNNSPKHQKPPSLHLENSSHNEGEFTQVDEEALEIKNCAFCNPKVIENQHVYTFGDFVGIYNFRPYILDYHFMVTPDPHHHIENWQYLSLEDTLKIDQLAQAFIKAIKKDSHRDDIVLFVQNGFAGGMTVPHSHLHILLRPSALRLITMNLLEVTGHDVDGIKLTPEEMKPTREKFKNLVGQFLTHNP